MRNQRFWQNCWAYLWPNPYRRAFNRVNSHRIKMAIRDAEHGHRGEIRLVVETQLPLNLVLAGIDAKTRAKYWFSQLGVWDTEENSGILLYLLLAERKIEIMADRGIHQLVPQQTWDETLARLRTQLAAEHVVEGLSECLQELGQILREHFPLRSDDNPDELCNELVFIP